MFRGVVVSTFIGVSTAVALLIIFPQLRHDNPSMSHSPLSYSEAVRLASPAVVNIYTQTEQNDPDKQLLLHNLGSGVIMNEAGFILTNYHVIASGSNITVMLQDGRIIVAQIIGFDIPTDLAVLQINANNLPKIPQNKNILPQVGDVVLAIGNPFNVGQSITQGIISAHGRHSLGSIGIDSNGHQNLIQTDAAINAGNSGGALVNTQGVLIGINTAALQSQTKIQGIGFAIPYQIAIDVMQQLIKHGRVIRGFLGVSVKEISPTQAAIMQLPPEKYGVYITHVAANSPGEKAGVLTGDMLIAINQQKLLNARLALDTITNTPPGSQVSLLLLRNNRLVEVTATIEEDARSTSTPKEATDHFG